MSRLATGNAEAAGVRDATALTNLTWLVAKALGWKNVGSSACSFDPPTWGRWMGTPPPNRKARQERVIGAGFDLGGYVPRYADGECEEELREWLADHGIGELGDRTPRQICDLVVNQAIAHGVFK